MNSFYSSLVINSRKFPTVYQVFKPRYNKEFFKRITANVDLLEKHIQTRCRYRPKVLDDYHLKLVRENCAKLVSLRVQLDKLDREKDEGKCNEILAKIETIEDLIMPTVLAIPNRSSKLVPETDELVAEIKSDFQERQGLFKVLSHKKLSFINNCYFKSIVGPNSHYYTGIGAKLILGLSNYFSSELEGANFIPFSGLSLVKSAVIEANNAYDEKDYMLDPCRILENDPTPTALHLTEASRESLFAFITSLGHISSNDPLRLYTVGSSYRQGSEWFDGDDKRISQFETVHGLVLNSSVEAYSMQEYERFKNILWDIYKRLDVPARLTHCSTSSMVSNEFDAHRLDIWLPSLGEWLPTGRISHYRDFVSIRAGLKRGHIIGCQLYDSQSLVAAIMENRQTALGKFIIPQVLEPHMPHLEASERSAYLAPDGRGASNVLLNHVQKRHLVKRKWIYGHARQTHDQKSGVLITTNAKIFLTVCFFITAMVDWDELWRIYVPDSVREILYDYIYRPTRRLWWSYTYANVPERRPEDVPYSQLERYNYDVSPHERYRDQYLANHYGVHALDEAKKQLDGFKEEKKKKEEVEA